MAFCMAARYRNKQRMKTVSYASPMEIAFTDEDDRNVLSKAQRITGGRPGIPLDQYGAAASHW